ncbi:MAG: hypothetical protein SFV21_17810 [Rhodospirillaceae bacterium]|nr:hypothetical protein [Rhodospirillaceae bacterium]
MESVSAIDATRRVPAASPHASAPAGPSTADADEGGLTFWDMLDFINPLQHIPVVNTLYRELTGDTIKTPAKLVGSTLLGGPIGFASAMVDSLIEDGTGKDMGGHVMAMLRGEPARPGPMAAETQLAAAAPREFVPDYATAGRERDETEALLTAAQIAAQANVLGPLKRDPVVTSDRALRAADPTPAQDSPDRARAARFMPLTPEGTKGRDLRLPSRRAPDEVSVAELRARTRFAPGALNVGLPPASLAEAVKRATPAAPSASPRANDSPAIAADSLANFDRAMLAGLEKYRAASERRQRGQVDVNG